MACQPNPPPPQSFAGQGGFLVVWFGLVWFGLVFLFVLTRRLPRQTQLIYNKYLKHSYPRFNSLEIKL